MDPSDKHWDDDSYCIYPLVIPVFVTGIHSAERANEGNLTGELYV